MKTVRIKMTRVYEYDQDVEVTDDQFEKIKDLCGDFVELGTEQHEIIDMITSENDFVRESDDYDEVDVLYLT